MRGIELEVRRTNFSLEPRPSRLRGCREIRCFRVSSALGLWPLRLKFGDSIPMDLVTDQVEFKKLEQEALKLKPVPVFDLVLDDNSFVPGVLAMGDRALGVIVGGHTGFLPFADVPAVATRKVREALRVSGAYASPFVGWWLRQRRAAKVGALPVRPSWMLDDSGQKSQTLSRLHTDHSGELRCNAGSITYRSACSDWSVPVADVRLIGEYTNSDGPYLDDYFLVFLTAPEGGWHQASFYAKGRDETLAELSTSIGSPLECGLCNSTHYKTRIIWPPHLKNEDLMEVLAPRKRGPWQKLMHWGERDIRLSASALKAFEK